VQTCALPIYVCGVRAGKPREQLDCALRLEAADSPPFENAQVARYVGIARKARVRPGIPRDTDRMLTGGATRGRNGVEHGVGSRVVSVRLREHGRDRREQDEVIERSEEHTSELQSRENLVCRLLLE